MEMNLSMLCKQLLLSVPLKSKIQNEPIPLCTRITYGRPLRQSDVKVSSNTKKSYYTRCQEPLKETPDDRLYHRSPFQPTEHQC